MNKAIAVLLVIVLLIIGSASYLVWSIQDNTSKTINSVVGPFQESNSALQTKVAELLHPTPTIIPDPITIINNIQSLARLETIHYSVEKVITAEIGQGDFDFLFGDRLLFVAHGAVIAGIDMSKIKAEDMQMVNGVLNVRLPEAEIFVSKLDNDKSYVFDRQTGILTHGDQNLETSARQRAESEITKAALEDGIIEKAQINAEALPVEILWCVGISEPGIYKVRPPAFKNSGTAHSQSNHIYFLEQNLPKI